MKTVFIGQIYLAKQNVLSILSVYMPQSLFNAIIQNPIENPINIFEVKQW